MGVAYLILGVGMVAGTALLVAASLGPRGPIDFVLAAYPVAAAEVIVVALALSPFHALDRTGLLAASAAVLAGTALVWAAHGRPRPPLQGLASSLRDVMRDPVVAVLAAAVTVALAYAAALALGTPPNDYDALWYHLARSAFWKQEGAVAYIASANDERLNIFPPGAEIGSAWAMILEGGERFASLFQLVALAATVLAVYGISRGLGLGRRPAAFGGFLYASLPVIALQAATPLNDVVATSFLVIVVYFLVSQTGSALGLGMLSLALAVATKLTALMAMPLLVLVAAVLSPRRRWPAVLGAGAVGVVVGGFWYALNAVKEGEPLPKFAENPWARSKANAVTQYAAELTRIVVDAIDPTGSVGRDRFLYALAALALLAVGGGLALGRRSKGVGVVAGVAALLILLPLAFRPLHEGLLKAHQRLWLTLDERHLAFLAFDRDPTEASPLTSWYGPVSLLLLVAALPLVLRDVRRGGLHRGALVLLLSPIAYVVIVVLVVDYSNAHGRYLMPAVAMAATTWGVVLRVRPLAWAASAVATVTLMLVFVHYREKPAGFVVLGGKAPRSVWTVPRSELQHVSYADGPFAALDERASPGDTVALRIREDDVSYPYFGVGLSRTVRFLEDGGGPLTGDEDWLVIAPGLAVGTCVEGWSEVAAEEAPGWRLLRRIARCPGERG